MRRIIHVRIQAVTIDSETGKVEVNDLFTAKEEPGRELAVHFSHDRPGKPMREVGSDKVIGIEPAGPTQFSMSVSQDQQRGPTLFKETKA